MGKLIIIGLDGAPFKLIQRWADEGVLPNLKKLINNGTFGPLISTYLPETPIAWTSIVTGKNAGKHGIFDWSERVNGSYEIGVTLSTSCQESPLWEIIGREGKKVGVFNVPLTYPPREVSGYLISGFDTPSLKSCFTYPPSLKKEILSKIKNYVLSVQETYTNGKEETYVQGLLFSLKKKEETVLHLIDHYPTDFSIYVFMEADHLHHKLWRFIEEGSEKGRGLFLKVYQQLDEVVGKIVSRFDEDSTILVISDHGAGLLEGIMFINKWLMDEGFLKFKKNPNLYIKSLINKLDLIPKTYRLASKFGLGKWMKLIPGSFQHSLATSFISFKDVDWGKTKAYSFGEYGQIFINLKGREPQGIVSKGEEYEQLLKEITQKLLSLVHPKTGERMIKQVYRKEELYNGPMLEKAPDLTFAIGDLKYDSSVKFGLATKEIFGPPEFEDSGTHRREGILIASGKGIRKGFMIEKATLFDIAPTALYILNLPVPLDMCGRVLENIFEEEWFKRYPIQFQEKRVENLSAKTKKDFSPEESDMVKRKLRSLGYMD